LKSAEPAKTNPETLG